MIGGICEGDITALENEQDIIVGVSTRLPDFIFGRRVFVGESLAPERTLGEVITFTFDAQRLLHAIVCRSPGVGGWAAADEYIRVAIDCLFKRGRTALSTVYIGRSPDGVREGADIAAIYQAIMKSIPRVSLFWKCEEKVFTAGENLPPLKPFLIWNVSTGERNLHVAE